MEFVYLIGQLHVPVLLFTVGSIVWADSIALLWVLGKQRLISGVRIRTLHHVITFGLWGMILTGVVLASDRIEYLLGEPLFYVKMLCVTALVVNGVLLGRHATIATQRSFKELSSNERFPLYISALVSILCWVGAMSCGFLL